MFLFGEQIANRILQKVLLISLHLCGFKICLKAKGVCACAILRDNMFVVVVVLTIKRQTISCQGVEVGRHRELNVVRY